MNIQFNLFGFEIQVNRPVRYGVAMQYEGMDQLEDRSVWESQSAFYLVAVFRGWKHARLLARLHLIPVTYLVFKFDSNLCRITQVRSGTIRIHKSVSVFSV